MQAFNQMQFGGRPRFPQQQQQQQQQQQHFGGFQQRPGGFGQPQFNQHQQQPYHAAQPQQPPLPPGPPPLPQSEAKEVTNAPLPNEPPKVETAPQNLPPMNSLTSGQNMPNPPNFQGGPGPRPPRPSRFSDQADSPSSGQLSGPAQNQGFAPRGQGFQPQFQRPPFGGPRGPRPPFDGPRGPRPSFDGPRGRRPSNNDGPHPPLPRDEPSSSGQGNNARPGDWLCGQCAKNNFSFRTECKFCKSPKDFQPSLGHERTPEPQSSNNQQKADIRYLPLRYFYHSDTS